MLTVKRSYRILGIWGVLNALFLVSLLLLPHKSVEPAGFISYSLQSLLAIISINIFRLEPTRKNRYIFLNFAFLFGLSFMAHIYSFIGPGTMFLSDSRFIRFFLDQYVFHMLYFFLLALAIVYIAVDLLLRDFATLKKYLVTVAIVGGFLGYYYHPFLEDPLYLHHTQDVLDWKVLQEKFNAYQKEFGQEPTPEALAEYTQEMYTWSDGEKVGVLFAGEKTRRVKQIYPYLVDPNYLILVYKPLNLNTIYVSVLCLAFILLFFGYQYMKDPPQGAYIEKIMFFLLLFCTLEILHAYSLMKTLQWEGLVGVIVIGQYVSTIVLLLLVVFFALRLRFITSVKGEFYEQELAISPNGITRWRDMLDNVVIEKFFNRKLLLGRLMVDPRDKGFIR